MRTFLVCLLIGGLCCLIGANAAEKHHANKKANKNHKPNHLVKAKITPPTNIKRDEIINQLGDTLLREVPLIMDKYGLNPFLAPDQKQSIPPVNLELSNIKVYNLTNLQRTSDIIIMDDPTNRIMTAAVNLKFNAVELVSDYNAYIKVGFLPAVGSKGVLTAAIPEINVFVKVLIDFKDVNATLETMNLSMDQSHLNVKLSGNLEGNIANMAMPVIVRILQGVILDIVGTPLKKQINAIIYQIVNMINGYLVTMGNGNQ